MTEREPKSEHEHEPTPVFFEISFKPALDVITNGERFLERKGTPLAGLLKYLQGIYYPTYEYNKATQTGTAPLPVTTFQSEPKRSSGNRRKDGLAHGSKVDEQITRTVILFRKHDLNMRIFYDGAYRRTHPTVTAEVKAACSNLSTDTQSFWMAMRHAKLTPIATQVPVRHPSIKIATAVDVVTLNADNQIVLLEIKSGAVHYLYHTTGARMSAPFNMVTDCVANQHFLQLLFTTEMYKYTYPTHKLGPSLLIRLTDMDVQGYGLRPWCLEQSKVALTHLKQAYDRIAAAKPAKKRKATKKKAATGSNKAKASKRKRVDEEATTSPKKKAATGSNKAKGKAPSKRKRVDEETTTSPKKKTKASQKHKKPTSDTASVEYTCTDLPATP
jgi:hypothetical protein